MTDVVDAASMIDAAQQAAAGGDFPAAERLLREAAAIQEATLGSDHPDLASTLNNLAFACERTNNIADAERHYRRAHAIAVASLGPRHPFVATSVKNLVDFCAAHDIPIWTPPAAHDDEGPATQDIEADSPPDDQQEPMPVTGWQMPRTIALAALGAAVIVVVAFTMRPREAPSSNASPTATTPVPADRVEPAIAVERKPDATPPRVERVEPRERAKRVVPPAKRVTAQPVTLLTGQLCRSLEKRGSPDWQCEPAKSDLRPGTYTFYTRLMTDANTTVEHRWYRGGVVHQVMRLRVSANPKGGYRTFSSNTISPERAGDWKVELRAADGALLHEERFVVR
jgi:DUF2914 family protein/tetratricopeptide repeat protein